jgi:hypothetical protein
MSRGWQSVGHWLTPHHAGCIFLLGMKEGSSIGDLADELAEIGLPVKFNTLRNWKFCKWAYVGPRAGTQPRDKTVNEKSAEMVDRAAEKIGLTMNQIYYSKRQYRKLTDSQLLSRTTRHTLEMANIIMDCIEANPQNYMDRDPKGLATIIISLATAQKNSFDGLDRVVMLSHKVMSASSGETSQSPVPSTEIEIAPEHPLDDIYRRFGLKRLQLGHKSAEGSGPNGSAR